jgi:hypothetical protein
MDVCLGLDSFLWTMCYVATKVLGTTVAPKKSRQWVFPLKTYFEVILIKKKKFSPAYLEYLKINSSTQQTYKKILKTQNQTKLDMFSSTYICFLHSIKALTQPSSNFSNRIELIDTKNYHFSNQKWCGQLSFSTLKSGNLSLSLSLSLSHTHTHITDWETIKKNFV